MARILGPFAGPDACALTFCSFLLFPGWPDGERVANVQPTSKVRFLHLTLLGFFCGLRHARALRHQRGEDRGDVKCYDPRIWLRLSLTRGACRGSSVLSLTFSAPSSCRAVCV